MSAATKDRPTTPEQVIALLHEVKDPEVPAIDVVELGIVRSAEVEGARVLVSVTPTYSGCPATQVIEREIKAALARHGFEDITVKTVFSPPWTSDWIGAEAREKLRAYGIAPPESSAPSELVPLGGPSRTVPCPYCGSANTTRESAFGSTACKSIHSCQNCHQPFEHFKAI